MPRSQPFKPAVSVSLAGIVCALCSVFQLISHHKGFDTRLYQLCRTQFCAETTYRFPASKGRQRTAGRYCGQVWREGGCPRSGTTCKVTFSLSHAFSAANGHANPRSQRFQSVLPDACTDTIHSLVPSKSFLYTSNHVGITVREPILRQDDVSKSGEQGHSEREK